MAIALPCVLVLSCRRASGELSPLVFAAASTKDALEEVGRAHRARTGVDVRFSWGGSGDLARQILEGAPADAFVSADDAKMDELEKAGRLRPGSRRELLSNRIVVIVPKVPEAAASRPSSARDLISLARIAIADPKSAPAGLYARAWLSHEGVLDAVEPRLVPALDARAALAAVENGAVDAGVVYRTDASSSKGVAIAFEPTWQPKISYPVALVARPSARPATVDAARAFVESLSAPEARAVFERHGFGAPS